MNRQWNLTALQISVNFWTHNLTQFYKKQDIYNIIQNIRREELSSLIFLQTLLQKLQSFEKWYIAYQLNLWDQLQSLFFTYQSALKWLMKYFNILFIDIIYKMNKYNMSLIILTLITVCNKIFYVEFTFLFHEDCEYYDWLISHIKVVWVDVECLNSLKTAVTDKNEMLIEALEEELSLTKLLLYQWYINKNV